jgi:hypothetical protein
MSTLQKYPPYHVRSDGPPSQSWIVDSHGNDVVVMIDMSSHYAEIYGEEIMQILSDAMNRKENQ